MRRLPGILLLTGATLIVIVALIVSGLRLALPHLDRWRPAILTQIERATGTPVSLQHIRAKWRNFGPQIEMRDLNIGLEDGGHLNASRVTLALDVWQSLLHMRWQFRDLTFYQLYLRLNQPTAQRSGKGISSDRATDLFLNQFDRFTLRDSRVSFLTPSGQRAEIAVPQLTWLNTSGRHRAEGQISMTSFTGQHGVVQMRMDLRDNGGLLSHGRVWMQADDVDVKPWLSHWLNEKIDLHEARFSLQAWMQIKDGLPTGGDLFLRQGGAAWAGEQDSLHRLNVDGLTAHVNALQNGWQISIPDTRIDIDGRRWPAGALSLAWLPEQSVGGINNERSAELRVRAGNLRLEDLLPLRTIAQKFAPTLSDVWKNLRPQGHLQKLALDIPLQQPEKTRLQGRWRDLSWQQWKLLPGAQHVSGDVAGSLEDGLLHLNLHDAVMPYSGVFKAPLEIVHGAGAFHWRHSADGFSLLGQQLDVQAKALRARGDFRYSQLNNDAPWLGIVAGISTTDAGQAWRYFPHNLMGNKLADYLSGAIQGGKVDNATLVYGGNPRLFPYKHNEGQFEVLVPLRGATFAFQPGWPALQNLDMELDFINDGLWMKAPQVKLGGVTGRNLRATIPDYSRSKLLIDADISGPGEAVGPYFQQTPLKSSLGATLEQLQLSGDVKARLNLDIPLDGETVLAKGDVQLRNNRLFIKPLDCELDSLSGDFHFANGYLTSQPLNARWFHQPVALRFETREGAKEYQVGINLNGRWNPVAMGILPKKLDDVVAGVVPWQGDVAITLPYRGGARYQVNLAGDLKEVSSHLPSPLDKSAGEPLPVKVNANGDLTHFDLNASAGGQSHFASRWLLGNTLELERGIVTTKTTKSPALPSAAGLELNLPALNGEAWLALFQRKPAPSTTAKLRLPEVTRLSTPALTLGGQQWRNLQLNAQPFSDGMRVTARARELDGDLTMSNGAPWQAQIRYLYYNPQQKRRAADDKTAPAPLADTPEHIDFHGWPDIALRCAECWLWGQKYGRIDGDFAVKGSTLTLRNGLVDAGFARLTVNGEWINQADAPRTSLKGELVGKKIDAALGFFGLTTPVKGAPFDAKYDLHWRDAPWRLDERSLNGIIHSRLGKGQIDDFGAGHAGQLLRLISFDALLRKLKLDFSDTFGQGFYFDSVRSTAWIKDGVLHTDDMLVDGLEADIAMKGRVDFVRRELNLDATVTPAVSATVGVATAFAVNPIIGAAVFAASQVLSPLWNKISVLRYHISGPIDKPQINEVLRQPRREKAQ